MANNHDALVNEVAEKVATTVSKAWPNGYSHRDHFPQAVGIIATELADFKRAIELQQRRSPQPSTVRLAALIALRLEALPDPTTLDAVVAAIAEELTAFGHGVVAVAEPEVAKLIETAKTLLSEALSGGPYSELVRMLVTALEQQITAKRDATALLTDAVAREHGAYERLRTARTALSLAREAMQDYSPVRVDNPNWKEVHAEWVRRLNIIVDALARLDKPDAIQGFYFGLAADAVLVWLKPGAARVAPVRGRVGESVANVIVIDEDDDRIHAEGHDMHLTACGFCDVGYEESDRPVNCKSCRDAILYYKKLRVRYAKTLL